MIDIKTATELVKKHLTSTLIVTLMLGGGANFIWSEYKDLLKQKDLLAQENKKLNLEKTAFEKYRLDAIAAEQERKLDLEKREFILQQIEKENQNQILAIRQRANEYSAAFTQLQEQQKNLSATEQKKTAEEKIQKLMSEFSSMGVDLNSPLKCDDSQAKSKFDSAKSKYYEIVAVSQSYGLYDNYKQFFFHNSPTTWHSCIQ